MKCCGGTIVINIITIINMQSERIVEYSQIIQVFPHGNDPAIYLVPDEYITDEIAKKFARHGVEQYTVEEQENEDFEFNERKWLQKPGVVQLLYNKEDLIYHHPPGCLITRTFTFIIC